MREQQHAELVPGRRALRRAATLSLVSASLREDPQPATAARRRAPTASTATPRSRSGTTANQKTQPDGERQQRAARVGQQHVSSSSPSDG